MKKMNNKGQVLVLFTIILPILLLILIITIQIGSVYLDKQKTKNIIIETIKTTLTTDQADKHNIANKLIDINIKKITSKTIYVSENEIQIHITQEQTIFGKEITLSYKYTGNKNGEEIKISEG